VKQSREILFALGLTDQNVTVLPDLRPLGTKTGERGELLGGLVFIAVGIAAASGIL
jgi:hypothetical protein